ncbi:hypothetical protein [Pseudomonas sp. 1152_12]|uniref:hypothetical protein n=1 Tax=Pseudomonas sp. 1152_12 TaxID=2604455 RepID=UPI00406488CF
MAEAVEDQPRDAPGDLLFRHAHDRAIGGLGYSLIYMLTQSGLGSSGTIGFLTPLRIA